MSVPIPDIALVRRVEAAESGYTLSRLHVLERLPGNPVGIAYRRDGRVLAVMARRLPMPGFNRVVGMNDDNVALVPRLVKWFRDAGVRGRFDILPGEATNEVCRTLVREGFVQAGVPNRAGYSEAGFHASLYAHANSAPPMPDGVEVERVKSEGALETFLETYCDGWAVAADGREGFKNNVRGWLKEPGWQLYLARVDGEPAGTAILHLRERTGYLADASVAPDSRGRGAHAALIARRWADAAAVGADIVCSQANYLSTSYRNMIRAGLSLLHTQAIWTDQSAG